MGANKGIQGGKRGQKMSKKLATFGKVETKGGQKDERKLRKRET